MIQGGNSGTRRGSRERDDCDQGANRFKLGLSGTQQTVEDAHPQTCPVVTPVGARVHVLDQVDTSVKMANRLVYLSRVRL